MDDQNKWMSYIRYWPIPACVIDKDGIILATVKSFSEIFEEENLVGKNLVELMGITLKTIKRGVSEYFFGLSAFAVKKQE